VPVLCIAAVIAVCADLLDYNSPAFNQVASTTPVPTPP